MRALNNLIYNHVHSMLSLEKRLCLVFFSTERDTPSFFPISSSLREDPASSKVRQLSFSPLILLMLYAREVVDWSCKLSIELYTVSIFFTLPCTICLTFFSNTHS